MKSIVFYLSLLIVVPVYAQLHKIKTGNENVGFMTLARYDQSRIAVKEQAKKDAGRFLQINIWYPAASVTEYRNNFSDYVQLAGQELDESSDKESLKQNGIKRYFEWPASLGADKSAFVDFLSKEIPMLAWKNADLNQKDLPLVMLVHGFAADYPYLAEYLASHGFLVMQIPVKGTSTHELDYAGNGLETQVLDYEFGLNVLQKEFSIRPENIAAVGFSFGGQSAVALSIRNKKIKAVISLDGGVGSAFGGELLNRQSFYRLSAIQAAILHLYNPNDQYTDLAWLNRYQFSDRVYVAMKNMQHGHFTSFGILNATIPNLMGKNVPDPGNAYEAVMLMSKEFLEFYLKKKTKGNSIFSAPSGELWLKDCIVKTESRPAGSS